MRVLTIIGNGFDLGHGLPTLFDQFIQSNPSVYKRKYGVFQNDRNSWNQIESKYEALLCEIMDGRSWQDVGEEVERIIGDYGLNDYGEVDFYDYDFEAYDEELDKISDFIKLLEDFERDFLGYLRLKCNDGELKKYVPRKAIAQIIDESDKIVTFNYTHTAEVLYDARNVIHIHGDIDDSIVIGSGALDKAKNSAIDFEYPTRNKFSKDKHGLVDMMMYYTEDMDGNLVEDHFIRRFFDEVSAAASEKEEELFALLDVKSKDSLDYRQEIIEQLRSDHYDRVYIIGHSLGEADYAVFDAINKDAKVLYYYHYENEYLEKSQLLRDLNLEYEMIKDTELYK